jgi:hypothetical protein
MLFLFVLASAWQSPASDFMILAVAPPLDENMRH